MIEIRATRLESTSNRSSITWQLIAVKEALGPQVEEIARSCADDHADRGLSQRRGSGGDTLTGRSRTPWLSGKYAGDNAALALRVQRWIGSREGERRVINLALAEPDFVEMPTAVEILNLLQWAKPHPASR
ncbi:hypothetical protein V6L77_00820 [Pannonibacter sp. Pt2-lr]